MTRRNLIFYWRGEISIFNLVDTASGNHPFFSYFHYMIPHPPLLYDSSGNLNPIRDRYYFNGYENEISHYISYLKYGNRKIKEMIDKILKRFGNNVIIIIQGDHGFREYPGRLPREARYGILNAVYLPDKNYSNFNDSMNPVYTFKQILKNQFNTIVK